MNAPFGDRLAEAVARSGSSLVVGLDPDLPRLPRSILRDPRDAEDRELAAAAILAFNSQVLEEVAPFACAVKPQVAFYEQLGPHGVDCYEQTIALAHEYGLLVIGDIKRGDIGSTASAYANAHLGSDADDAKADAVTVNPYLGTDSMSPFLSAVKEHQAGLFVLVRTSNPSAGELQDLPLRDSRLVHEAVADLVNQWGAGSIGASGYSSVGAVVGATAPERLASLRARLPHAWFLLPGVGAQGATAHDTAAAFDARGLGAVVNSSRAILYAYTERSDPDWSRHIRDAARRTRDELRSAVLKSTP